MKPDWDKLSKKYADSDRVVVADVDCTQHQGLCGEHGVRGYPTIKYFLGGEAEASKGGRTLKDLKKFVKDNLLEAPCDSANKDACSEEQIKELETAEAMSAEDRESKIKEIKAEIKTTEKAHDDLLESLQAQFKASQETTETTVAELKKSMKWLKAASKATASKDEL